MKLALESLQYEAAPFRTPFKFGSSVISELSVPVVQLRLAASNGSEGVGAGAMPLGNAWSFPQAPYDQSLQAMRLIVDRLGPALSGLEIPDDPFDAAFALRDLAAEISGEVGRELFNDSSAVPQLCTLVASSCYDIALFDAWGRLVGGSTYALLRQGTWGTDLARWLGSEFKGYGLGEVLLPSPVPALSIFHVVGGLDPLTAEEVTGGPEDGLPLDLRSWIARDGLTHFKIKLRGADPEWDYDRLMAINRACLEPVRQRHGRDPVYSLDLNEQCPSAAVLLGFLQRLEREAPEVLGRIEFIEQPTSRDFAGVKEEGLAEAARIKPIVIDEGLTDFATLERALELGYSGVCLKACKGIGFSLLAAAVARRRGLYLCVQDLTCPGLAFLASASLAAWCGVDGLEANARQFCPGANADTARLRPEVFNLQEGRVQTGRLTGPGVA